MSDNFHFSYLSIIITIRIIIRITTIAVMTGATTAATFEMLELLLDVSFSCGVDVEVDATGCDENDGKINGEDDEEGKDVEDKGDNNKDNVDVDDRGVDAGADVTELK